MDLVAACGIFSGNMWDPVPHTGIKTGRLHRKHGILDTEPPGYSLHDFFFLQKALFSQNFTWKADTNNRSSMNFPLGGRMKDLHVNPFGFPSVMPNSPPCVPLHSQTQSSVEQRWETTDFVFQNLGFIISKLGTIILIWIKCVYHQKISQPQHWFSV